MEKKTQQKRIIIMASGNGSNFEAIAKACQSGKIDAQIIKLMCDNPKAYVFQRAKALGIRFECIDYKSFSSRKDFDEHLLKACQNIEPDFIVLAGFMKILSADFVRYFRQQIINIHPSLLPKYPGTRAIEKAWNNQDKQTGVTVHYVDEGVDTGEVILQKSIALDYDQSFEQFCQTMHALEHETYIEALQKMFNNF